MFYRCGWCDQRLDGMDLDQVRRDIAAHQRTCPAPGVRLAEAWAATVAALRGLVQAAWRELR